MRNERVTETDMAANVYRLPKGVLFHMASTFDFWSRRPLAAIITYWKLFPALHGRDVAVLQLSKYLQAKGYRTVWINQSPKIGSTYVDGLQSVCDRYFDAVFHITRQTSQPCDIKGNYVAEETLESLRWIDERFGIDLAVAEYAYMAPCLSALSVQTLKMVQTIDVVSRLSVDDLHEHGIRFYRGISKKEEAALLRFADVVIAITDVERTLLQEMLPDKQVITVGYATPPSACQKPPTTSVDLLFLASSNPFNRDGAVWFINQVFPAIRKSVPDVRLLMAGQVCSRLKSDGFPELLAAEGVVPLGAVDNVKRLYASSAVVVNPTRFGTGLKIKTVEAIAEGKPVVSTSVGCEGLPYDAASPFIVADDAAAFASACTRLLQDEPSRKHMEDAAIAYARKYFSTKTVFGELQAALAKHEIRSPKRRPVFPKYSVRIEVSEKLLNGLARVDHLDFLEVGYPSQGVLADILYSHSAARHDVVPPITCMDELDYQWMKTNGAERFIDRVQFHRMPPDDFFQKNKCLSAYDCIYLHGEFRFGPLLRILLKAAPLLKPGGLLVIDGYGEIRRPDITHAVDNFVLIEPSCISMIAKRMPSRARETGVCLGKQAKQTILIAFKYPMPSCPDIACSCLPTILPQSESMQNVGSLASQALLFLVREKLASLNARSPNGMAVFGAGAHTAWLDKACQGLDLKFIAIVDEFPNGKGPFFGLLPVRMESFAPDSVDAIVLSSDCHQREMTMRLRQMYGDGIQLINLYEGLPPGPYAKSLP